LIDTPPSVEEEPPVECPPPQTAISRLFLLLNWTVAETSSADVGNMTKPCSTEVVNKASERIEYGY
jgi:hypothetical protein